MLKKPKSNSILSRIWYFIWEDDSIYSWIVNVILAYLLIKFIVYPGLGLVLGTTHPVVAVVSGSMEHGLRDEMICGQRPYGYVGNIEGWWNACGGFYADYNITEEDFRQYSFKNGFNTGDLIVLIGRKPEKLKIGDVIVFNSNRPDPIIHRIIKKETVNGKYVFTTKGDHNSNIGDVDVNITEDELIGRAVFRIPLLGYIKIAFVYFLNVIGVYKYLVKYRIFM